MRWWHRCKHLSVRCVHGDEIIARGWVRVACATCGRSLPKLRLPDTCTVTGERHASALPEGVQR